MRRALPILKYIPAALCGVLVVAWVVTLRNSWEAHSGPYHVAIGVGALEFTYADNSAAKFDWIIRHDPLIGSPSADKRAMREYHYLALPIPLALTAMLPTVVAPFTRFRFPLWFYFAWTTLVAAELAYYLR
jgi:hypothetical protein